MNKERLRKKGVIGFIALGLILLVIDMNKPAPKVIEGSGVGFNNDINVKLTVIEKKNSIKVIDIQVNHEDTAVIADPAIEKMKTQFLKSQDCNEIDVCAGATYTSKGFIEAVQNCMENN